MGGLALPFQGVAGVPPTADESSSAFEVVNVIGGVAITGISGEQVAPTQLPSVGVLGVSANISTVPGLAVTSYGVHGKSTSGDGVHGETQGGSGVFGSSTNGHGVHGESINQVGTVGISTNNIGVWGESRSLAQPGVFGKGPGIAAEFQGDVEVTGNLNVSGEVNVTGDVFLANFEGKDLAEQFEIDEAACHATGMLMIIGRGGKLTPCDSPYDRRAVGIIAGAGATRPAITLGCVETETPTVPIALAGTAYCLADADLGPIEAGDLLTSSGTPGHAMKASDPMKSFGAVVGKALAGLSRGRGLVPMVIALQ